MMWKSRLSSITLILNKLSYRLKPIKLIAVVLICVMAAELPMQSASYAAASPERILNFSHPLIQDMITGKFQNILPADAAGIKRFIPQSDSLVVVIEDAHVNYSGQKNIARIIRVLSEVYGINEIFVEGGTGDVGISGLKAIGSRSAWAQAAEHELLRGNISGEEYLALSSELPLKLFGVEDRELYDSGLKHYAAMVENRVSDARMFSELNLRLNAVKGRVYSRELLEFEKSLELIQAEQSPVKEADLLSRMAPETAKKYEALNQMLQLDSEEEKMDFQKARFQYQELSSRLGYTTDELKTSLSQLDTRQLIENMIFQAGQSGIPPFEFDALSNYLKALKRFSSMDLAQVLLQLEMLRSDVYRSLLTDEDSGRIHAIDRMMQLYKKGSDIRMARPEYREWQKLAGIAPAPGWTAFLNRKLTENGKQELLIPYTDEWNRLAARITGFYDNAIAREEYMTGEVIRRMEAGKIRDAALITGGFHTDPVIRQLSLMGKTVLVLSPKITAETDHDAYEQILLDADAIEYRKSDAGNGTIRPVPVMQSRKRRFELAVLAGRLSGLSPQEVRTQLKSMESAAARLPDEVFDQVLHKSQLTSIAENVRIAAFEIHKRYASILQFNEHSRMLSEEQQNALRGFNYQGFYYRGHGQSSVSFSHKDYPGIIFKTKKSYDSEIRVYEYEKSLFDIRLAAFAFADRVEEVSGFRLHQFKGVVPYAVIDQSVIVQAEAGAPYPRADSKGVLISSGIDRHLQELGLSPVDPNPSNFRQYDSEPHLIDLDLRLTQKGWENIFQLVEMPQKIFWNSKQVVSFVRKRNQHKPGGLSPIGVRDIAYYEYLSAAEKSGEAEGLRQFVRVLKIASAKSIFSAMPGENSGTRLSRAVIAVSRGILRDLQIVSFTLFGASALLVPAVLKLTEGSWLFDGWFIFSSFWTGVNAFLGRAVLDASARHSRLMEGSEDKAMHYLFKRYYPSLFSMLGINLVFYSVALPAYFLNRMGIDAEIWGTGIKIGMTAITAGIFSSIIKKESVNRDRTDPSDPLDEFLNDYHRLPELLIKIAKADPALPQTPDLKQDAKITAKTIVLTLDPQNEFNYTNFKSQFNFTVKRLEFIQSTLRKRDGLDWGASVPEGADPEVSDLRSVSQYRDKLRLFEAIKELDHVVGNLGGIKILTDKRKRKIRYARNRLGQELFQDADHFFEEAIDAREDRGYGIAESSFNHDLLDKEVEDLISLNARFSEGLPVYFDSGARLSGTEDVSDQKGAAQSSGIDNAEPVSGVFRPVLALLRTVQVAAYTALTGLSAIATYYVFASQDTADVPIIISAVVSGAAILIGTAGFYKVFKDGYLRLIHWLNKKNKAHFERKYLLTLSFLRIKLPEQFGEIRDRTFGKSEVKPPAEKLNPSSPEFDFELWYQHTDLTSYYYGYVLAFIRGRDYKGKDLQAWADRTFAGLQANLDVSTFIGPDEPLDVSHIQELRYQIKLQILNPSGYEITSRTGDKLIPIVDEYTRTSPMGREVAVRVLDMQGDFQMLGYSDMEGNVFLAEGGERVLHEEALQEQAEYVAEVIEPSRQRIQDNLRELKKIRRESKKLGKEQRRTVAQQIRAKEQELKKIEEELERSLLDPDYAVWVEFQGKKSDEQVIREREEATLAEELSHSDTMHASRQVLGRRYFAELLAQSPETAMFYLRTMVKPDSFLWEIIHQATPQTLPDIIDGIVEFEGRLKAATISHTPIVLLARSDANPSEELAKYATAVAIMNEIRTRQTTGDWLGDFNNYLIGRMRNFKKLGRDLKAYSTSAYPKIFYDPAERPGVAHELRSQGETAQGARLSDVLPAERIEKLEEFFSVLDSKPQDVADGAVYAPTPLPVLLSSFGELQRKYGSLSGKKLLDMGAGKDLRVGLVGHYLYGMHVDSVELNPYISAKAVEVYKLAVKEGIVDPANYSYLPEVSAFQLNWSSYDHAFFYFTQPDADFPEALENFREAFEDSVLSMKPGAVMSMLFVGHYISAGFDRFDRLEPHASAFTDVSSGLGFPYILKSYQLSGNLQTRSAAVIYDPVNPGPTAGEVIFSHLIAKDGSREFAEFGPLDGDADYFSFRTQDLFRHTDLRRTVSLQDLPDKIIDGELKFPLVFKPLYGALGHSVLFAEKTDGGRLRLAVDSSLDGDAAYFFSQLPGFRFEREQEMYYADIAGDNYDLLAEVWDAISEEFGDPGMVEEVLNTFKVNVSDNPKQPDYRAYEIRRNVLLDFRTGQVDFLRGWDIAKIGANPYLANISNKRHSRKITENLLDPLYQAFPYLTDDKENFERLVDASVAGHAVHLVERLAEDLGVRIHADIHAQFDIQFKVQPNGQIIPVLIEQDFLAPSHVFAKQTELTGFTAPGTQSHTRRNRPSGDGADAGARLTADGSGLIYGYNQHPLILPADVVGTDEDVNLSELILETLRERGLRPLFVLTGSSSYLMNESGGVPWNLVGDIDVLVLVTHQDRQNFNFDMQMDGYSAALREKLFTEGAEVSEILEISSPALAKKIKINTEFVDLSYSLHDGSLVTGHHVLTALDGHMLFYADPDAASDVEFLFTNEAKSLARVSEKNDLILKWIEEDIVDLFTEQEFAVFRAVKTVKRMYRIISTISIADSDAAQEWLTLAFKWLNEAPKSGNIQVDQDLLVILSEGNTLIKSSDAALTEGVYTQIRSFYPQGARLASWQQELFRLEHENRDFANAAFREPFESLTRADVRAAYVDRDKRWTGDPSGGKKYSDSVKFSEAAGRTFYHADESEVLFMNNLQNGEIIVTQGIQTCIACAVKSVLTDGAIEYGLLHSLNPLGSLVGDDLKFQEDVDAFFRLYDSGPERIESRFVMAELNFRMSGLNVREARYRGLGDEIHRRYPHASVNQISGDHLDGTHGSFGLSKDGWYFNFLKLDSAPWEYDQVSGDWDSPSASRLSEGAVYDSTSVLNQTVIGSRLSTIQEEEEAAEITFNNETPESFTYTDEDLVLLNRIQAGTLEGGSWYPLLLNAGVYWLTAQDRDRPFLALERYGKLSEIPDYFSENSQINERITEPSAEEHLEKEQQVVEAVLNRISSASNQNTLVREIGLKINLDDLSVGFSPSDMRFFERQVRMLKTQLKQLKTEGGINVYPSVESSDPRLVGAARREGLIGKNIPDDIPVMMMSNVDAVLKSITSTGESGYFPIKAAQKQDGRYPVFAMRSAVALAVWLGADRRIIQPDNPVLEAARAVIGIKDAEFNSDYLNRIRQGRTDTATVSKARRFAMGARLFFDLNGWISFARKAMQMVAFSA